ncbi:MAG: Adenylyl-sulfate kinase [Nocardioidaceae bacterium]|nr:Adenylyl-sulfate kinase [Nocardioidaceae bacterium]
MSHPEIDWAYVGRLPTVVVDRSDLDLVELCLGGALAPTFELAEPMADPNDAYVLTDPRSTPIALARRDMAGELTLVPLRPIAQTRGPHGDPNIRLPASAVRPLVQDGTTLAVAFGDLPSRSDLDVARAAIAEKAPVHVAWCVLAGRGGDSDAYAPALVRATTRLADEWKTDLHVVKVVVPWSSRNILKTLVWIGDEPLTTEVVLHGYGANSTTEIGDLRHRGARNETDELAQAWQREASRLFPDASVAEMRKTMPHSPRDGSHHGAVVMFTGLSGSGKSTLARAFADAIHDEYEQAVSLLDGDEFRQLMSYGLGFDRASRELNIKRIGYVSALVAKHGGIAVAAPIAPFADTRAEVRRLAEEQGVFMLVHMATPLEICESRDSKGMYARARAGIVTEFTGISSPYEAPEDADVTIDSSATSVEDSLELLLAEFRRRLAP